MQSGECIGLIYTNLNIELNWNLEAPSSLCQGDGWPVSSVFTIAGQCACHEPCQSYNSCLPFTDEETAVQGGEVLSSRSCRQQVVKCTSKQAAS